MADTRQPGRAGSIIKSFELQVFRDGVWKIDAIFDDAEFALLEARRADEGKRYAGIRVVEERYDEETDRTTLRTLFRGGVVNLRTKKTEPPVEQKRSAASGPQGGVGSEPELGFRQPPARRGGNALRPILLLVLVLVGGAVALYALHVLGR